jgi:hypothetical protein
MEGRGIEANCRKLNVRRTGRTGGPIVEFGEVELIYVEFGAGDRRVDYILALATAKQRNSPLP